MRQTDVLIIGGGILGCAAAYYLARQGVSVIVADKGSLASEATGTTTAGLTLQNRSPGRLPFYEAAAQYWPLLGDELGADLGYNQCGSLTIARTVEEFDRLQAEIASLQALGLEVECISMSETKSMAPWIAEDISGAGYCSRDGFVEPNAPPKAFIDAAGRYNADFLPDHGVTAIAQQGLKGFYTSTTQGDIQSRIVVNAAGAWAGQVAALVGVEIPVTLDPLQAMATESMPPWLDKVVLHVNRKLTIKQNQDGRVVIGGGWKARGNLDGSDKQLIEANREGNLALARASVPRMNNLKIEQSWVGLEGRSPDRLPFFGEVSAVPGFYLLACVHGGFTMSPLLGSQMAELIVDGNTSFPMRDFTSKAILHMMN